MSSRQHSAWFWGLLAASIAHGLGCDGTSERGGDGAPGSEACVAGRGALAASDRYPLGFASTVTGKVIVIDLEAGEELTRVTGGFQVTHGVAVLPGQQELYYGNQGTQALDRVRLSEDRSEVELLRSVPMAGRFKRLVASSSGRVIGVGGQATRAPWDDTATFLRAEDDSLIGTWTVTTDTGEPDPEQWEPEGIAPRLGVVIAHDDSVAWVSHAVNHTVTKLSLEPFAELETWSFEPADGVGPEWEGPSAHLSLSPDGAWLAVPGYGGERLLLVDTEDSSLQKTYETPGQITEQAAFAPDCGRLWVLGREGVAILGDEGHNINIPSHLHVVDLPSMEIVTTLGWRNAMTRIAIPASGGMAWATGSFYALLGFDLESLGLEQELVLGAGIQPLLGIDF